MESFKLKKWSPANGIFKITANALRWNVWLCVIGQLIIYNCQYRFYAWYTCQMFAWSLWSRSDDTPPSRLDVTSVRDYSHTSLVCLSSISGLWERNALRFCKQTRIGDTLDFVLYLPAVGEKRTGVQCCCKCTVPTTLRVSTSDMFARCTSRRKVA
jgi:hypothetical protein